MPTAPTSAIDRFFDLADAGIDQLNKLADSAGLGDRRGARSGARKAQAPTDGRGRHDDRIDVRVNAGSSRAVTARRTLPGATSAPAPVADTKALAVPCRIVDAVDAETGVRTWVVTNGRDRAECNSERLAKLVKGIIDHG